MTIFGKGRVELQNLLGRGRRVSGAAAHRRRINPVLWALGPIVLSGYLMIGHPLISVVTTATTVPAAQVLGASPVSGQLSTNTESTAASKANVVDAALGTVLAAGWLLAGAWIGIRSARISAPRDEPEDKRSAPDISARIWHYPLRSLEQRTTHLQSTTPRTERP